MTLMKSVNFASVLFIAAALGLWACQHTGPADKVASVLQHSVAKVSTR
jgi:hypothetical protein